MKLNASQSFWTAQNKIYNQALSSGTDVIKVLPGNPYVIKFIKNPTKEQQMAALMSEPRVLKYIKNPDEYAAIRAIKLLPWLVLRVKKPTEEMWVYALSKDPNLVFKSKEVTWRMFECVYNRVKKLNTHKGLDPAMRTALILVS